MKDIIVNINSNEALRPGIQATAKIFIGCVANINVNKNDKNTLK
jgi:hypothetical protein